MYGRYTKDLGEYAKEEARRAKLEEKKRRKEDKLRDKELKYRGECSSKFAAVLRFIWKNTFAKLGEDWVFLALLGLIMALLSFVMDRGISLCNKGELKSFDNSKEEGFRSFPVPSCGPIK